MYLFTKKNVQLLMSVSCQHFFLGIHSIARCCKAPGLRCSYVHAGPSGTNENDKVQTRCPRGSVVTGEYLEKEMNAQEPLMDIP